MNDLSLGNLFKQRRGVLNLLCNLLSEVGHLTPANKTLFETVFFKMTVLFIHSYIPYTI